MNNDYIGSNFDDFLNEEWIFAEAVAVKCVIAFQFEQMIKEQNLSRVEMSRRMNTSRAA